MQAAFADLASLPGEPCGKDCFYRLLHGSDRDLPGSVCVRGAVACSTPRAALPSDGTPKSGVDHAANSGSISVGALRDRDAIYGRDFAALTTDMRMEEVVTAPRAPLAESLCGTAGGVHPAGMSGRRH